MALFSRPVTLFLTSCSKTTHVRTFSSVSKIKSLDSYSKFPASITGCSIIRPAVRVQSTPQSFSTSSCFLTKKQSHPVKGLSESNELDDVDETKPYVIYDGPLSSQLERVKLFSITTSSMGLVMQPVVLQSASETHVAATVAVLGMIGFFTYVTPFLIHQLAKKYVVEMIYDPENDLYTAITKSFFLRRKELKFKKEDVIVPEIPGPFTTILVNTKDGKKTGLFMALDAFRYPIHYGLLMGYDKPLDLHLSAEDVEIALKKKKEANKS